MKRQLNVSIIQMPISDTAANLKYLEDAVDTLMKGYVTPELVVGVELGVGEIPDTIPGKITDFLGAIAKKHGIYFIPGTMLEKNGGGEEGKYYNSCPVFAPDGSLITKYRKKIPFRPGETILASNDDDYCIFKIAEKDISVGLLVCYDQFFPEIPRTLALKGAEIIICPAYDPIEFNHIPDVIPRARALENELFYVWTNSTGINEYGTSCGNSIIIDPEGNVIYKCGDTPTLLTKTLDIDLVAKKRNCGQDQHLNTLRYFDVKYPYAQNLKDAPVYKDMLPLTNDSNEYKERLESYGMSALVKQKTPEEIRKANQELKSLYEEAIQVKK
ncbi:MAG TPA: carbon-nitrogen hydrolase family protein [Bacillota bacterium]|nr:carbon-nitrogen hydrolase family protein [Bacillota bacterium]